MKPLYTKIKVPALKGKATIADSKIFTGWLDSDFQNWSTNKPDRKTAKAELAVCEIDKPSTFSQIFTNPEAMCLTQEQILYFVKNHKNKLREDGYATLFLFKTGIEFFVAHVYFHSDGRLEVFVDRFSRDSVWRAGDRHRVVVPKLSFSNLDVPLAPSSSDTLTLEKAIEMVKEAGMVIYKPI